MLQGALQLALPKHSKIYDYIAAFISKQLLVTNGKLYSYIQDGIFLIALTKFWLYRAQNNYLDLLS